MVLSMKITDVKAAIVDGNFDWLLVKVETDEGIEGYGEAFPYADAVKPLVLRMKRMLMGEDPTDVGRLWRKMGPSVYGGFHVHAVSAVETALLDITGKAYGVPVYRLLGGKFRERIPIYCDCHSGKPIGSRADYQLDKVNYTPEAYAENARRIKRQGFNLLKFDIGLGMATLAGANGLLGGHLTDFGLTYFAKIVEALRDAIGYDLELALDCGMGTVSNAVRFVRAVEEYRLAWVEDILPSHNVDGWAVVTASSKTPTLTGETLYLREGFRELIERQAIRIVAPDFQHCGGLIEGKKIAELAAMHGMLAAPHNICTPLGTMASVHACAAIPNLLALEFHAVALPWWENLVKGVEKPIIKDGYIGVPDRPGLGVELNEEEIRKHLRKGESYFE